MVNTSVGEKYIYLQKWKKKEKEKEKLPDKGKMIDDSGENGLEGEDSEKESGVVGVRS